VHLSVEMEELHGPFYRLRGADLVSGLPQRIDGPGWEVWIGGGTIIAVRPDRDPGLYDDASDPPALDCRGLAILPGLVDLHVHAVGDCGPGGFHDRTSEPTHGALLDGGVTTFVGVLGADTFGRNPRSLLAKVRALSRAGGLTGLACMGASDGSWPPPTLTGSIASDLALVNKS
jgi:beta-aspartyl-dipeptidase (metallo-type)